MSATITATPRPCTLAGFLECSQDGQTGCCDVEKTVTACPTGYFSCASQFLEPGYGGACCPNGYTCQVFPSCASYITSTITPETVVSIHSVTTVSTVVSVSVSTVTASTESFTFHTPNTLIIVRPTSSSATGSLSTTTSAQSTSSQAVITARDYQVKLSIGGPDADTGSSKTVSSGAIAGAVIGSVAGVALIASALWWFFRRRKGGSETWVPQQEQKDNTVPPAYPELSPSPLSELPQGHTVQPYELPAATASELPANSR